MANRTIVSEGETEFGSYAVEDLVYEGRSARVLFSGPMHLAQSGIPLDGNPELLFDYNKRLLELAIDLKPENVLVLGGGTMTLAIALISSLPNAKLTVVEINAEQLKLAGNFFNYRPNQRLEVVVADAAEFLSNPSPEYDLIIVDLFDNFSIPAVFKGLGFARRIALSLRPGSVVACNCITELSGEEAKVLKQLTAAYSSAIGPVRVVQANNIYDSSLPQNLIVLSGNSSRLKGLLSKQKAVALPELKTEDYLT